MLNQGEFPLPRNFYVHTHVNEIEAMYDSRPLPIVLVKYWKVAHWNAKKLLPKFQKLPPKFLDIFK